MSSKAFKLNKFAVFNKIHLIVSSKSLICHSILFFDIILLQAQVCNLYVEYGFSSPEELDAVIFTAFAEVQDSIVLIVSGCFKQDATDTAADKMAKTLEVEATNRDISFDLYYSLILGTRKHSGRKWTWH